MPYATADVEMASVDKNGRLSSSAVGVVDRACSISMGRGVMCPAMLEMKTPDPPAAMTSSKASSTMAAPSRSTARIASGAACTGDRPAMDHRGHGPDLRSHAGQRCDGRGVGDVDLLSDVIVPVPCVLSRQSPTRRIEVLTAPG